VTVRVVTTPQFSAEDARHAAQVFEERLGRIAISLAPIVHHAPDVAQKRVVLARNFGKATENRNHPSRFACDGADVNAGDPLLALE